MNIGHPAFLLIALFLSSTPLLAGESPTAYCSLICPSDSSDDDYPICDTPAAFPLPPFGCSGFFLTYEQGVANFGPIDFFGDPAPVGAVGAAANATGYNSQDGYLYAVRGPDEHILRLHDDGTVDDLGGVGLPNNIVVGGFDENGNYYVKTGNDPEVYIIDVAPAIPTVTIVNPSGLFFAKDWAYHVVEDKFYGVHATDLYAYDPGSNSVQVTALTGIMTGENTVFGAAWYAADEFIYVLANNSGNLYRVNVQNNEARYVLTASGLTATDGASCADAFPNFPVVCAHSDTICVPQTGEVTYDVIANDAAYNTGLDLFSFNEIDPPSNGSYSFDPSTGEITYTSFGSPVMDEMTYEICGSVANPYVCDYTTIVFVPGPEITFPAFGPYCVGDTPDPLPGVSDEGVSGSWSPGSISTATDGIFTYTFTPDPSLECSTPISIDITIDPANDAAFSLTDLYCEGDATETLPNTSDNGISGQWSPAVVDNQSSGTYTFTPDPGQCAAPYALDVVIEPLTEPVFNLTDEYCEGACTDALPTISDNGISGQWFPDVIDNQNTDSYIFTPDAGQCAASFTLDVSIMPLEEPSFLINTSYCAGDATDGLPTVSNEGISGEWFPDVIDNQNTDTYTFTPDAGECATPLVLEITIEPTVSPSFLVTTMYCAGEATDPLPSVSANGVSGEWFPDMIDNQVSDTYTFTPDDGQCAEVVVLDVIIEPATAPTFSLQDQYCEGAATDMLPSTSDNGISGSWFPSVIDNTVSDSYTFTPSAGQCAAPFNLNVTVEPAALPSFNLTTTYCAGSTTETLPSVSDNGISGTWNPATIDNQNTATYTFTPDDGQCTQTFILEVSIEQPTEPTFNLTNNYCAGSATETLPGVSDNGISGTWNPAAIDNQNTATYTFTPDDEQCAQAFVLEVSIEQPAEPTFNLTDNYCAGSTTETLPSVSDNGISGMWNPATIDNQNSGSYTFTPDVGQCAQAFMLEVSIEQPAEPTFNLTDNYCAGSTTETLPSVSDNGISGQWNPATIDNQNSGSYTFTPDAGQCAQAFMLEVSIEQPMELTFNLTDNYCAGSTTETLPGVSDNGISGMWNPATIDNQNTATYTFTPDAGQCAQAFTLEVSIEQPTEPAFNLTDNYCAGSTTETLPGVSDNGISGQWNPATIDNQNTATYTFTPDAGQCAQTFSIAIDIIPPISITPSDFMCAADLSTYDQEVMISGGSGIYVSIEAESYTIVDAGNGNYIIENIPSGSGVLITVADDAGCSASLMTVPQDCNCGAVAPPTGAEDQTYCFGASVPEISVDNPPAGFQLNWYDSANNLLSNNNPFMPSAAGTYFATVEEISSGCESTPVSINVSELPPLVVQFNDFNCAPDLSTYDQQMNVASGSGAPWQIDAGTLVVQDDGNGDFTILSIPAGTGPTIEVIDNAGCSTAVMIPAQNCDCPAVPAPMGLQNQSFCAGSPIPAVSVDDPGADYVVNWYDEAGNFLSNDNPFTPTQAGTFSARLQAVGSTCEGSAANTTITAIPSIIISPGDFICNTDLTAYDQTFSISGGSGTFSTLSANGFTIQDNGDGTYTVLAIPSGTGISIEVIDDAGCMAMLSLPARDCNCPTVIPPSGAQSIEFCAGDDPGLLMVDAPGNGFAINWYDGVGNFLANGNTFSPPTAGTYFATNVETATNCESTPIELTATSLPAIQLVLTSFECAADLSTFTQHFSLSGGSGNYSSIEAEFYTIQNNGNGTYSILGIPSGTATVISITDDAGCMLQVPVAAQNCDCPTVMPPTGVNGNSYCFGSPPTALSADAPAPGFQLNWYGLDGQLLSNDPVFTPTLAGIYTVSLQEIGTNCESEAMEAELVENPLPIVGAGADLELNCHNEPISLNGSVNQAGLVLQWQPAAQVLSGANTLTPAVNSSGIFELTATDPTTTCTATDQLIVSATNPLTLEIQTSDAGCANESNGNIVLTASGGADPLLYSIDGGATFVTTPLFSGLPAGEYELVVQDFNECESTGTASIIAHPEIDIFTDEQLHIQLGESAELDVMTNLLPAEIDTIIWSGTDSLSCTDCLEPSVFPSNSANYQILVIDTAGCSATALINIIVDREVNVFVPNAFSPDGDGTNDLLRLYPGPGVTEVLQFQVFSRWGESLYSSGAYSVENNPPGWDGKHRGQPLNPGTFVYQAELRLVDGTTMMISGDVVLLR